MSDITARAEFIRETTGTAWEYACLQAERERDEPGYLYTERFPEAARAAREGRPMNSDEQRADRWRRLEG